MFISSDVIDTRASLLPRCTECVERWIYTRSLPRPRRSFVLPYHKYTGPYNSLDEQLDENDQPLPGQEPYNAVDALSMRHDICYRDNDTIEGKHKCDDIMLQELDVLQPHGFREKIERKLVRSIIGWGIDWRSNELADELHKPIRKKFKKRRVFTSGVDAICAADLVEMQSFSRSNKGFKYILMIIDVFSKYGWAVPLKSKTGLEVTKSFQNLWRKQAPPQQLWTDKGKEFYNGLMTDLLEKNSVQLYSTENEEKSSVVERWNRTIRRMMWKYFTANNTTTYINVLQEIIDKYNRTYHRSIRCKPTLVREPSNYQYVFEALCGEKQSSTLPKYNEGDRVRIVKKKKTFEKGFTPNWTEELFTINKVKDTKPVTYTIDDTKGKEIQGTFYEPELQKPNKRYTELKRYSRSVQEPMV